MSYFILLIIIYFSFSDSWKPEQWSTYIFYNRIQFHSSLRTDVIDWFTCDHIHGHHDFVFTAAHGKSRDWLYRCVPRKQRGRKCAFLGVRCHLDGQKSTCLPISASRLKLSSEWFWYFAPVRILPEGWELRNINVKVQRMLEGWGGSLVIL